MDELFYRSDYRYITIVAHTHIVMFERGNHALFVHLCKHCEKLFSLSIGPQYLEWVRPKFMTLYVKLIPKQIVKTVVFCCKPNVKGVIILFVGKMPDLSLCPLLPNSPSPTFESV